MAQAVRVTVNGKRNPCQTPAEGMHYVSNQSISLIVHPFSNQYSLSDLLELMVLQRCAMFMAE